MMPRKYVKKGPERPEQMMLSLPKLQGSNQLAELIHVYGGHARMAKDLMVSRELLDMWTAPDGNPPYHFLVAAYFIGPYGMSQAFSESHWANQQNSFLKNQALDRVAQLEHVVKACSLVLGLEHPALCMPISSAFRVDLVGNESAPVRMGA